ncbi:hypothetical protein Poly21_44470 [Allorhodopirellula heiligendammensis]|uniref:Transposase n=1 Tax=Allorhodopirellula heiligendammensis TaxID=2714739 RepID=A0A5C6BFS7_9BACT|nr:hypothetical protein Poly21_44470 [Allorhodopirellula heiligendammensis]
MPSRRQVWAERFSRYQASSLTVKAFCQAENVSVPNFYQWKKKLAAAATGATPAFVPVNLNLQHTDELDLVLPGGATLKLNVQLDEAVIRKVIAATIAVTSQARPS